MKRGYYTPKQMAAQLTAQGGLCATWGCHSPGPFEADHHIPNAWEPGKPTQLLCIPCHRAKTKQDVKNIAKVKRIRKRAEGKEKPKRKIRSAPFRKDIKKDWKTGKVSKR